MTIPRYFGFTDFTPVIPQLYWNVYSNEQRIKALCKELCKIIQYADMLGVNVDEIKQTLQDIQDGKLDPIIVEAIEQWFAENQPEIMQELDLLTDLIANTRNELQDQIGEGFSAQHSVEDAFEDEARNREQDINDLKDYFDSTIKNMSYPEKLQGAFPLLRVEFDYTVYNPQGFCIYPYENPNYILVYLQNKSSQDGVIQIYDFTSKVLVNTISVAYGHGSAVDYDNENNRFFIIGANENNYVYELDATNPVNPVLSRAYDFSQLNMTGVCYYKENKFIAVDRWAGRNKTLYLVDLATMTTEILCNVPVQKEYWPGLLQSYHYDSVNDVISLVSSNGGAKTVFFKPSGELLKTMEFEQQYSFIPCCEIEDVQITGNRIWFNNNVAGFEGEVNYRHVYTVFEGDLLDPAKNCNKLTPTNLQWVTVVLNNDYSPYNDYENGNNSFGATNNPIRFKYAQDLLSLPFAVPNMNIHVAIQEDYIADPIIMNGGGQHVTIDGNNHLIAGAFLQNGFFALRTMGANASTFSQFKITYQNLPVLCRCYNAQVMLQNVLNNTGMYSAAVSNGVVYVRDTATQGRVANAGNSISIVGVQA